MFARKTTLTALILGLVLGAAPGAFARNDIESYPIKRALDRPDAEKLDSRIKLYFGNRPHGLVVKTIGEWKSTKKANGFGRADEVACQRAFLSAVVSLQQRASKMGGNAVINIKSYYERQVTSSETTYVCGSGGLMSGVALIGTVVKIGK